MKLYAELAEYWPLLSAVSDYEEEASFYLDVLRKTHVGPLQSMLELGSGGGNNASFMKRDFERVVLVDLSPQMLEVSRSLNPECDHVEGDMRTFRTDETFDFVFVHDAVCYMTTPADLLQAIITAAHHCRPGGTVVLAPDYVQETFETGTDHGGHDGADGRGLRYLEWTHDPNPADTIYTVEYACITRDAAGGVRVMHETHHEGIFARAMWLQLMDEAGLDATVHPFEHSDLPAQTLEVFAGRKR